MNSTPGIILPRITSRFFLGRIMGKPVFRVLIPGTLEYAFIFVADILKTIGLSIENPGRKKVTTWADDGDQKEISVASVVGAVVSGGIRNVQFWKTSSEDVFVAWQEGANGYSFSIYLDGVDHVFLVMLASKLTESVLMKFGSQYGESVALAVEFE